MNIFTSPNYPYATIVVYDVGNNINFEAGGVSLYNCPIVAIEKNGVLIDNGGNNISAYDASDITLLNLNHEDLRAIYKTEVETGGFKSKHILAGLVVTEADAPSEGALTRTEERSVV